MCFFSLSRHLVNGRHSSLLSTRALLSSSSYFTLTHIAPPESTIHFFFVSAACYCLRMFLTPVPPFQPSLLHRRHFISFVKPIAAHTINRQNIQIITTTSTSAPIGTEIKRAKEEEERKKKRRKNENEKTSCIINLNECIGGDEFTLITTK